MFGECPHCHRRVLPLADGECPSCHKNTKEVENANRDETMLAVSDVTKFPDHCCSCNAPTKRRQKITRSGRLAGAATKGSKGSSDGVLALAFVFNPIVALLAHIASTASRGGTESDRSKLTVQLPRCDKCVAEKEIDVAMVDLEHHRLGIIVNRKFALAVGEMNRR